MSRLGRGFTPHKVTGAGIGYERNSIRLRDELRPGEFDLPGRISLWSQVERGSNKLKAQFRFYECRGSFDSQKYRLVVRGWTRERDDLHSSLVIILAGLLRANIKISKVTIHSKSNFGSHRIDVNPISLNPSGNLEVIARDNIAKIASAITWFRLEGRIDVVFETAIPDRISVTNLAVGIARSDGRFRSSKASSPRSIRSKNKR